MGEAAAKFFKTAFVILIPLFVLGSCVQAMNNPFSAAKDFLSAGYSPEASFARDGPWAGIPETMYRAYTSVGNAPDKCQFSTAAWAAAVGLVESGWNAGATSTAGAEGPQQIMPGTLKQYGVDGDGDGVVSSRSPLDSVFTANRVLCTYEKAVAGVRGDPVRNTLAAYNWGPGAVVKAQGTLPTSVAQYVRNVEVAHSVLLNYAVANNMASPPPPGEWGGFANGRVPESALEPIPWAPGERARPDAVRALVAMNAEWKKLYGRDIGITDGYRTYEEQVAIAARNQGNGLAATPGGSNHGWGVAFDLNENPGKMSFRSRLFVWLKANGPRFGFFHPAFAAEGGPTPEPWHWEFGRRQGEGLAA